MQAFPESASIDATSRVLVALSGGADSVALLLWMQERGCARLAAAHCHFGLRGAESDRDADFVRRLCAKRGVPLFVRRFQTREEAARTGESVEMAARRLRYDWFEQLCRDEGFDCVAVAHHREDNAETILLNLVRGTGLRGLTGMAARRGRVARPLLGWSKAKILDYLARRGQDYVTDSTNADTRYRRNKIRHEVLPLLAELNPSIVDSLVATAGRLREAEAVYACGLARLRADLLKEMSDGRVSVDRAALLASPAPVTLLHEWFAPYGFSEAQLREMLTMRPGAWVEAKGRMATLCGSRLLVGPVPEAFSGLELPPLGAEIFSFRLPGGRLFSAWRIPRSALADISTSPDSLAMDAAALRGRLTLRSVRPSDRFRPFGLHGTQLVSDYLTARHRSRFEKLSALVLCDDEGIVWLVGERPADRVAVRPSTREVVCCRRDQIS